MNEELRDAILAAESFREERDEARAEVRQLKDNVALLRALVSELQKVSNAPVPAKLPGPLRDHQRKSARRAAESMCGAFGWGDSPQGHAYWNTVYQLLTGIADGKSEADLPS